MDFNKIKVGMYLIAEVRDLLHEEETGRPFRAVQCRVISVESEKEIGVSISNENQFVSSERLWTIEGYVHWRLNDGQPKFIPGTSRERQLIRLLAGLLSRIKKEGPETADPTEVIELLKQKGLLKENPSLMEIIPAINYFK